MRNYYYKCPECNKVLKRNVKIKKGIAYCGNVGLKVKLKRISKRKYTNGTDQKDIY